MTGVEFAPCVDDGDDGFAEVVVAPAELLGARAMTETRKVVRGKPSRRAQSLFFVFCFMLWHWFYFIVLTIKIMHTPCTIMKAKNATIRAAVCRAFGGRLSVEDVRLPMVGAAQVRVRVMACAVCHSDIIFMDGGWGGVLPCVYGHEAAGVVVECGADVAADIKEGRRVVVSLLRSCGSCGFCRRDAPALCDGLFDDDGQGYGLRDADNHNIVAGLNTGAFAEEVVVHHSQVAPIDDKYDALGFDEASLLACGVLTGWGAVVNTAKVSPGESVAVVGCGGVGANSLQAAKIAGASPVVAVDRSASILKMAAAFGADAVCLAGADDEEAAARAREINNGRGFDVVVMAAGSGRAVELSAKLLSPLGAMVVAGMPRNDDFAKLDAATLAALQQRILGSKMGGANLRRDIGKLLKLHGEGKLKLGELIAARFSLSQINDAVDAARAGGMLRNVVVFN